MRSSGVSSSFYARGEFRSEGQPAVRQNVVQQQRQVQRTVGPSGRAAGDHKRLQEQCVHDLRGGEARGELAEAERRAAELQGQATAAHGDAGGIREDTEEDEGGDEDRDALRQDTKVLLQREERQVTLLTLVSIIFDRLNETLDRLVLQTRRNPPA